jgi:flagellar hook-length control protein FliK
MSSVGSMNSFANDTQIAPKVAKSGSSRGGNDHERAGDGFDALLAGLVATVPTPLATSPVVQDEAHQSSQIESQQSAFTDQASSATMPGNERATDANLTLAALAPNPLGGNANTQALTQPVQTQLAGEVSSSIADTLAAGSLPTINSLPTAVPADVAPVALPTDATPAASQASSTPAAVPASATPVALATDATPKKTGGIGTAQSATSQTDALPAAATQTRTAQNSDGASTASATNDGNNAATSSDSQASQVTQAQTGVANDNGLVVTAAKPKLADVEVDTKTAAKSVDAVALATDSRPSASDISGQEMATAPTDQAARPPQLTPHTIPMLAATMMRRLESGAKQFTMRLDPPELGQVEVKLTVAADKKVRAVVSADRPEALADLVRSARDLARALQEAGLDLEENGLSFSLNDPSGNQQQHKNDNSRDQAGRLAANLAAGANVADEEAVALDTSHKNAKPNDPFQSWQRARIAITA